MLRLFSGPRIQAIFSEKARKYAVYAVGEVFLVVVGILIAFQIDTWNENKKLEILKSQYLESLVSDLRADSTELSNQVDLYSRGHQQLMEMSSRLSGPGVTRDTLEQIARYEFAPFFDPSNELNRSTLASLVATGDIKLYDHELRDRLIGYNTGQIDSMKLMDENVEIFLDMWEGLNFPPSDHQNFASSSVKGPLLDELWAAISDKDLANLTIRAISGKSIMFNIVGRQKRQLLASTTQLLEYLRAEAE